VLLADPDQHDVRQVGCPTTAPVLINLRDWNTILQCLGVIHLVAGSCCVEHELMLRDILGEELSDSFANGRRVFLKREDSVATTRKLFGLPAVREWRSNRWTCCTAVICDQLSPHDVGYPDRW
jgi:hypothetical protein